METTIVKHVKGEQMEAIFSQSSRFSVKFFKALDLLSEDDYKDLETYKYQITVRHPEGTDANILFDEELERFK